MLLVLVGSTPVVADPLEGTSAATPPAAQAPAPPVASIQMPPVKSYPHAVFPPDQLMNNAEGQVLAHFKIDGRGRAIDGVLNYDLSKKTFAEATADWLHAVRFKVSKGWAAADSPTYDILFLYALCSDTEKPKIPTGTDTMVITGCKTG
jgi:hypothetical protein